MRNHCKHIHVIGIPQIEKNKQFVYIYCTDCGYIKRVKVHKNKGMKTKSIKIKGVKQL